MRELLIASCLVACSTAPELPDLPTVQVTGIDPALGADVWGAIGFTFDSAPDLPDCPSDWYDAAVPSPCRIWIQVSVLPDLRERYGTNALSDRANRLVALDTSLTGLDLCVALAHEVGHVLLDTPEHTRGGVMGGVDCVLAPVDYDLACREIGACVDP